MVVFLTREKYVTLFRDGILSKHYFVFSLTLRYANPQLHTHTKDPNLAAQLSTTTRTCFRLEQSGWNIADIFKHIKWKEMVYILLQISETSKFFFQ